MFDSEELEVSCEACGGGVKVKAGNLRRSASVTCGCGQEIKVDATQLDRALQDVDRAEKKLGDTIKGMNLTIG
jgi:hypothetical protein